jgi:hypothetical protein
MIIKNQRVCEFKMKTGNSSDSLFCVYFVSFFVEKVYKRKALNPFIIIIIIRFSGCSKLIAFSFILCGLG